jgi:hypothetical protein
MAASTLNTGGYLHRYSPRRGFALPRSQNRHGDGLPVPRPTPQTIHATGGPKTGGVDGTVPPNTVESASGGRHLYAAHGPRIAVFATNMLGEGADTSEIHVVAHQ